MVIKQTSLRLEGGLALDNLLPDLLVNLHYHARWGSIILECRRNSATPSGQTVSLKEIEKARAERRKQVRAGLSARAAIVEQFLAVHQEEAPTTRVQVSEPEPVWHPRLKGYINER